MLRWPLDGPACREGGQVGTAGDAAGKVPRRREAAKETAAMFNIGAGEITVILIAALVVLGPDRLPELARTIGKFMREFRRHTDEVRGVVLREFYKMEQWDRAGAARAEARGRAGEAARAARADRGDQRRSEDRDSPGERRGGALGEAAGCASAPARAAAGGRR